MLIKLSDAIREHGLNITGIIHVGGHHGQEFTEYRSCGVRNIVFIEPCRPAFQILKRRFTGQAKLYNCALGAFNGTAVMNVETANTGQSNSLLKPKKHLQQYPSITFNQTELVQVRTMDSLKLKNCNMLNMDVQGYELEVLKGGTETLRGIDIIYTEVNRDEVYEGCARVEQLDAYLKDFERVQTDWSGGTWGDAIYVRTKKISNDIGIPSQFRPHIKYPYPTDNDLIFEEWFAQNFEGSHERTYLPIFWTSYYVNHKYGQDKKAITELQNFLNSLDKKRKYFTICQYDDGILNAISHLDLKVFGMSGPGIDYPLPLLCKPHKYEFVTPRTNLANFVGRETHPIRSQMIHSLSGKRGYYLSTKAHRLPDYCKVMAESIFTLCPRGYGPTSFRIQEAMQFGSIPVYISDKFVIPHNIPFNAYGIQVKENEIGELDNILRSKSQVEIKQLQQAVKKMYSECFTYESNKKLILENL